MTQRSFRLSMTALVAVTALTLSACGGGSATTEATGASADGSGEKISIIWDMWAGGEDDEKWLQSTADVARAKFPNIDIEVRTASWKDYFTKLTANASSGNLACITSMNGQRLNTFAQTLSPLTEEDLKVAGISESDFAEGAFDILSYDGKLYGLPYDVAAMMLYYNKDLLAAAGAKEPTADWTFDDFMEIAKTATTDTHKGFGIGMGEFQWMALPIAKAGVQPVAEDGKLDLTNPKFVEAAEWYAGLVTKEKVADPAPSASELGWGEEQYKAGNVAMAIGGTWNARKFFTNEAGFKAGATRVPRGENGSLGFVLGSGFGIGASCEGAEREAALKVLGAILSKDAQDIMASSGRSYPAVKASQPLYFEALDENIREDVKKAFEAAFTGVVGQRSTATWAQVNEYFTPNLLPVYTGNMTMTEMLETAQKQFGN